MRGTQQRGAAFGGMSTEPDVKRIRDKYPDTSLVEGSTAIDYQEIADLLVLSVDSNRFKTVVSAWRRAVMRESGKVIKPFDGKFHVLDDSAKFGQVKRDLRGAGRKIRKARTVGSLVDRKNLNEDERQDYDHKNFVMSKLIEADRLASKTNKVSLIEEVAE